MGDNAPDEGSREAFIIGKLNDAKNKYGKYVGLTAEEKAEEKAKEEEPAVAEEAAEAPAEQAKEEEMGSEEAPPEDAISALMNKVKSIGGERHSLSAKSRK